MEWLIQFQGQIIGLDTAPIIYFIEQNPTYLESVRAFFAAINRGEFQVVTSTLTLTEVLVHPLKAGNVELACEYRDIILNQEHLTTFPVSAAIAERAAQLRASYHLRTPDAIQIATAIQEGATVFLTNDGRLPALVDLEILVLNDLL
jgi:predicted nucleic acid-binding protein